MRSNTRSFRWHDWPRYQKLAKQGLSLDVETSLIRGRNTLRDTLMSTLPADMNSMPSYIVHHQGQRAIGQLRHASGDLHARIAFVAPGPDPANPHLWQTLLEALMAVAGQRGAVNLIAEVDDTSLAFDTLHRTGFGIYARQQIWRREPGPVAAGSTDDVLLCRPIDEFNAMVLYANLVPGLLQQAEPDPVLDNGTFILTDKGDIVGLVTSQSGALGTMMETFIHPAAHHRLDQAINGSLHRVDAENAPVYIRVRRYQDWLGNNLAKYGFSLLGQQAVMVRHTVARIERRIQWSLPDIRAGVKITKIAKPMPDVIAPPGQRHASK